MDLVSVVIPNYNGARTLAACIGALRAQTYPNVEIILADDGSTDGSAEIARAFEVTVVRTASNSGSGVARNLGASVSTGQILFYVDSDLALAPDAIARAVEILDADPAIGAVCGVQDAQPLLHDTFVSHYQGVRYHYWLRSAEGVTTILPSSICAIPVRVQQEIGGFNPALRQTEEFDLGIRISERYTMIMAPSVHGRHAHDPKARILLHKLYQRARDRIPMYAQLRRFATGFETPQRSLASLAAAAALPCLMATAWLGLWSAAAGLVLIACSIGLDAGMYRFAVRLYGPFFAVRFAAMHYLVNLTIMAGVLAGVVRLLVSPRFRRLYAAPPPFVRSVTPAVPGRGDRTGPR